MLPFYCFWVGVERWNLIAWIFLNEIKFGTKGGSSQNNRDSIYNVEDVVIVDIVVLLLYI